MVTKESIVELYLSENSLSLRRWGVASRLKSNPDETLIAMNELLSEGILCRQSGYYQLNTPHLWKNPQFTEKYRERAEERIVNYARDFLLSVRELLEVE